jgi:uncharacterized protein
MTALYPRWQKPRIEQALRTRRVLLLSGARQCGKTTLAKELVSKDRLYRTLDDLTLLEAAQSDPQGFVKHHGHMLIIDEVQHVPALLRAIKKVVDDDNRPGQYLLTGSANIQSLPGVTESLAGRMSRIRLRALTQGEMRGKDPQFLTHAFNQSFEAALSENDDRDDRDAILEMALRGGFPEAVRSEEKTRRKWHQDYIASLLERDLKDIANIKRQDAMRELIRILAAWSGKFMDISAIASGLAIQRPTVESYINALEALYLVERVPPWTRTDYDRVGKQSKLFLTDCGAMSALLGFRMDTLRFNVDRVGKLMETFIFNELAAHIDASETTYELFHYRDREQREIDFLIERDDGNLLGVEVKAGSVVGKDDFKHLRWFKHNLAKEQPFIGIILYSGEHIGSFGDGLWAIPATILWS